MAGRRIRHRLAVGALDPVDGQPSRSSARLHCKPRCFKTGKSASACGSPKGGGISPGSRRFDLQRPRSGANRATSVTAFRCSHKSREALGFRGSPKGFAMRRLLMGSAAAFAVVLAATPAAAQYYGYSYSPYRYSYNPYSYGYSYPSYYGYSYPSYSYSYPSYSYGYSSYGYSYPRYRHSRCIQRHHRDGIVYYTRVC
jgi:hypothetical protein